MIVGSIKFFTRWINSWIYGISLFFAGCTKSMVMFFIQYSVGMFLGLLGYEELSLFIIEYIESISAISIAGIVIHIFVLIFLTWYFLNSSIDPVVRVKDYSSDHCQLENLEIQLSELMEKSEKESGEILEIQKHFDEELEKSKKVSEENKNLKQKVEENEADKKKIEKLQHSIKGCEDEIEIKACELDKLQIALQCSKDDVECCKSEYKELEIKFLNAIKELDIKDCAISDFEDGEKDFKRQLSDKDKEISGKEELVNHLYEKIKGLEKSIIDLEDAIGEGKKLYHSVRLEKEVLEETLNINKIPGMESDAECQTDGEDTIKVAEKLKAERLAMLTDASKIKAELSETKSELVSCKDELTIYKQKNINLEGKYKELAEKI